MKRKLFLSIAALSIGCVLIIHKFRERQLNKGFEQSYGTVSQVLGGKNGGGIQFSFKGLNANYKPATYNGLDCNDVVRKILKKVQKYKFPVVYHPTNQTNAEILLFASQYKKFGIGIPKELEAIVTELSACEKHE